MNQPMISEETLHQLQRDMFDYFLKEVNPANGLVLDKTHEGSPSSIAAVGFALAVYPVGVERGFMTRNPPGKLADAELHFTHGVLAGLKLIGFSVWERRNGAGRNADVTFPARQYAINGERRSFALLRPTVDPTAQAAVRDAILEAYTEAEAAAITPNNRRRTGARRRPASLSVFRDATCSIASAIVLQTCAPGMTRCGAGSSFECVCPSRSPVRAGASYG